MSRRRLTRLPDDRLIGRYFTAICAAPSRGTGGDLPADDLFSVNRDRRKRFRLRLRKEPAEFGNPVSCRQPAPTGGLSAALVLFRIASLNRARRLESDMKTRHRSISEDTEAADNDGIEMSAKIYGIRNCDTMKKAFTWLSDHDVAHEFHDYRAAGIDARTLRAWVKQLGWEKVLNKASTTFKELADADKADLDEARAIALMVQNPTMIKRPMLVTDKTITAGFKPDIYASLFQR
jgi:arsenate reductase (glutaredoxin)